MDAHTVLVGLQSQEKPILTHYIRNWQKTGIMKKMVINHHVQKSHSVIKLFIGNVINVGMNGSKC